METQEIRKQEMKETLENTNANSQADVLNHSSGNLHWDTTIPKKPPRLDYNCAQMQ